MYIKFPFRTLVYKPAAIFLILIFIQSCFFYPKVNPKEKNICELVTKKLKIELVAGRPDFSGCDEPACIVAGIGIYLGTGVVTGIVSGSIVVVGNTIHWIEQEGTCDDGVIKSAVNDFFYSLSDFGYWVADSADEMMDWFNLNTDSSDKIIVSSWSGRFDADSESGGIISNLTLYNDRTMTGMWLTQAGSSVVNLKGKYRIIQDNISFIADGDLVLKDNVKIKAKVEGNGTIVEDIAFGSYQIQVNHPSGKSDKGTWNASKIVKLKAPNQARMIQKLDTCLISTALEIEDCGMDTGGSVAFGIALKWYKGYGVEKDYTKSLKWLLKADTLGHSEASKYLCSIYYFGQGIDVDLNQAKRWCLKASVNGFRSSQFTVGYMFHKGYGFSKDVQKAEYWYLQSAQKGYLKAQVNLGRIYEKGEFGEKRFDDAAELYYKAAVKGDAKGQFRLGGLHLVSGWEKKDLTKALKWLRKAADQEYPAAQFILGALYEEGEEMLDRYFGKYIPIEEKIARDLPRAFYWYSKASKNGYVKAHRRLARFYKEGTGGTEKNIPKALQLLKQAE